MSLEPRDPKLTERFAELRRVDAAKAPAFASMWRGRARRTSAWWLAVPAVSFAAAAAALALWIGTSAMRSLDREAPTARVIVPAPQPEVRAIEPDPLAFLLDEPALARVGDLDSDPTREP